MDTNIKITGWCDWDDTNIPSMDVEDYGYDEAVKQLCNVIKDNHYCISSHDHLYNKNCVPVVNNEYALRMTVLGWGSLMKYVYGGDVKDWSWKIPDNQKQKIPKKS